MTYVPPLLTDSEKRILIEPATPALLGEVVALLSRKTGVAIVFKGHYLKIGDTLVPVGDYGLPYSGFANYGDEGTYIHLKNPSAYAFGHELAHMIQMVTERGAALGDAIEVPAAIAERWMLGHFALRTEVIIAYDLRLTQAGKMLATCLQKGIALSDAKAAVLAAFELLPIPADNMVGAYADPSTWERALVGHYNRHLEWGGWARALQREEGPYED